MYKWAGVLIILLLVIACTPDDTSYTFKGDLPLHVITPDTTGILVFHLSELYEEDVNSTLGNMGPLGPLLKEGPDYLKEFYKKGIRTFYILYNNSDSYETGSGFILCFKNTGNVDKDFFETERYLEFTKDWITIYDFTEGKRILVPAPSERINQFKKQLRPLEDTYLQCAYIPNDKSRKRKKSLFEDVINSNRHIDEFFDIFTGIVSMGVYFKSKGLLQGALDVHKLQDGNDLPLTAIINLKSGADTQDMLKYLGNIIELSKDNKWIGIVDGTIKTSQCSNTEKQVRVDMKLGDTYFPFPSPGVEAASRAHGKEAKVYEYHLPNQNRRLIITNAFICTKKLGAFASLAGEWIYSTAKDSSHAFGMTPIRTYGASPTSNGASRNGFYFCVFCGKVVILQLYSSPNQETLVFRLL